MWYAYLQLYWYYQTGFQHGCISLYVWGLTFISPILGIFILLDFCKFDGWEILYHYKLNLLFTTAKEVEHLYCSITRLAGYWPLFPLLPAHVVSSILFSHFLIFKLGCLSFSHRFVGSFYLFRIIMFVSFELQIISQSVFFSFLFIVSFVGQKFLMLTNFSTFFLMDLLSNCLVLHSYHKDIF